MGRREYTRRMRKGQCKYCYWLIVTFGVVGETGPGESIRQAPMMIKGASN